MSITFMFDDEAVLPGWSLYRLFDAEDRLLYIGCSRDVYSRIYSHEAASSSMLDAAVIQRHATRCYIAFASVVCKAAFAMEADTIRTERPLLNRVHNHGRWQTAGREWVPVDDATRREVEWLRGTDPVKADALAAAQQVHAQERMREALGRLGDLLGLSAHAP